MSLKDWLKAITTGEATLRDFLMIVTRYMFVKAQSKYNFYIKKEYFINNMKKSEATIMVLIGKYAGVWEVSLKRIHEYSGKLDVVLINAGGFNRELSIKLSRDYGFSYFESYPNNIVASQNYFIAKYLGSEVIIKMDDDVFVTKNTFKNLLRAYHRLKSEGLDIGFIAPVLNVNNYSYYHFLKTLGLLEEYEKIFGKPLIFEGHAKRNIWQNPDVAKYIWEKSLPLNHVAQIFEDKNKDSIEIIPTRFSIGCILFEKSFLMRFYGYLTPRPRFKLDTSKAFDSSQITKLLLPYGDEESINFFADTTMHGRFLVLDSFAGHLSYRPQSKYMLDWFRNNKERLLEDLNY
jgi:hypothetical protein